MGNIKTMNKGEKYAHATIGCIKSFEGKQFVKEATEATSCEVSFGSLPTGASAAEPMIYICIQAKDESLEDYTMTDAEITERESLL